MSIGFNLETYLTVSSFVVSIALLIPIIKSDVKHYGLLYLISALTGVILCYIFIYLRLYSFPYLPFPKISRIPFTVIISIFPLYVLYGVKYSPKPWPSKICFYWVLVHIGVLSEVLGENLTGLIKYGPFWHAWESYTWWWIFLLVFELVGGVIVPQESRKPLNQQLLLTGKPGWFITHFVLIATIFLGGVYAGITLFK